MNSLEYIIFAIAALFPMIQYALLIDYYAFFWFLIVLTGSVVVLIFQERKERKNNV